MLRKCFGKSLCSVRLGHGFGPVAFAQCRKKGNISLMQNDAFRIYRCIHNIPGHFFAKGDRVRQESAMLAARARPDPDIRIRYEARKRLSRAGFICQLLYMDHTFCNRRHIHARIISIMPSLLSAFFPAWGEKAIHPHPFKASSAHIARHFGHNRKKQLS